jgi:hypothetical protein
MGSPAVAEGQCFQRAVVADWYLGGLTSRRARANLLNLLVEPGGVEPTTPVQSSKMINVLGAVPFKAGGRGRGRDTAWQLPTGLWVRFGRPSHHRNEIAIMRSARFCGRAAMFSAIRRHNGRQGNSLQGRL